MKELGIEVKTCRRSFTLSILPIVGVLGGLYALLNFAMRTTSLLGLDMKPMAILLTQVYGMMMILNMFGIVVSSTMIYAIEFQEHAIKMKCTQPISITRIFFSKSCILFVEFCMVMLIEGCALAIIGNWYLPKGTFEWGLYLQYMSYLWLTSLPVLFFMGCVASYCRNLWVVLGIGVIGFISGIAMSFGMTDLALLNPFVIMFRPTIASDVMIQTHVVLWSCIEVGIFCFGFYGISKNVYFG